VSDTVLAPRQSPTLRLGDLPMIWMYHGVASVTDDPHKLCVSPRRFAAQLDWLERRGLRGVSMATLLEAMGSGALHKLVGITFDDGYKNVLEHALPELSRRGFTATAFVIADRLGGTNEWDSGPVWPLLSAAEVRELARGGFEIGSHSSTHRHLEGLRQSDLEFETRRSREKLQAIVGTGIGGFAYPYGSMDRTAQAAVADAGYDYACAVETPLGQLGTMALPRVYIGEGDDGVRLELKARLFRFDVARREVARREVALRESARRAFASRTSDVRKRRQR
jgi:peptidoglycan/xylan/chitin deacetylase (PgdA/CDA1 family)